MKKLIFVLITLLAMPSIVLAAKGGNKPQPVDLAPLYVADEEISIALCNLYDFTGAPLPLLCKDFCGDGIQESFEECDDGNIESGDGCAADCTLEVIDCGSLSSPTNGSVVYDQSTYGSVATYSCNVGYSLSGSTTRTCQSDGTWSGVAPICEQDTDGDGVPVGIDSDDSNAYICSDIDNDGCDDCAVEGYQNPDNDGCTVDTDDDGDGYSENGGDCDDSNDEINPGIVETNFINCGDGIDHDCDGIDPFCIGG